MNINRYFQTTLAAAILSLLLAGNTIAGQDEGPGKKTIKAITVTKNLFMLQGKGGNIGVFVGSDGTFLIDDQYAPVTPEILENVQSLGGNHPKFLINTHYHGDHSGGNENLGSGNTLIFSHDNVRTRLTSGAFIAAFKAKMAATAKIGLPVVTFSEDMNFHINSETIRAQHVPHAHTDGDSFIHFSQSNVIHAGDIFFNGFYPYIDVDHGGSLRGMIGAVDEILVLADEESKIIPGHGPLSNKRELVHYRNMLQTSFDRLRKLRLAGKSVQEAVAANPLADQEKEWGDGLFSGSRWIEIVYLGVY
jgi:cyclase